MSFVFCLLSFSVYCQITPCGGVDFTQEAYSNLDCPPSTPTPEFSLCHTWDNVNPPYPCFIRVCNESLTEGLTGSISTPNNSCNPGQNAFFLGPQECFEFSTRCAFRGRVTLLIGGCFTEIEINCL